MTLHVVPRPLRTFVAAIVVAGAASSGLAQSLSPGERITTDWLEVKVPASPGWRLAAKLPAQVAMASRGSLPDETFAGFAHVFRIEPPRDREHFLDIIRKGVAADTPAERFRELKAEFQPDDSRGYPCIRYHAVHEDTQARLLSGGNGTLILQSLTQYCQHPQEPGAAFAVGYSHRGHQLQDGFEVEAAEFIASADVRRR